MNSSKKTMNKQNKTGKLIIKQTENEVRKAVKEYLEFNGWTVFRINNTGIWNEKKKCHIFHGDPGVADLYAVKPNHLSVWVETKRTGEKSTLDQEKFGYNINSAKGAYWCYADSLDMFLAKMKGFL